MSLARAVHRRLLVGLLAVATLVLASVQFAPAAAAQPSLGPFELVARHSNKCLDVAHFSNAHAANIVQGNCSRQGQWNQNFSLRPNSDGSFLIVARHSGMCVDVANRSRAHLANVLQATCRGTANQRWKFFPVGGDRDVSGTAEAPRTGVFYKVMPNHASGRCLDVAHVSIAHAADVIQATCWLPAFNQQWQLVPAKS